MTYTSPPFPFASSRGLIHHLTLIGKKDHPIHIKPCRWRISPVSSAFPQPARTHPLISLCKQPLHIRAPPPWHALPSSCWAWQPYVSVQSPGNPCTICLQTLAVFAETQPRPPQHSATRLLPSLRTGCHFYNSSMQWLAMRLTRLLWACHSTDAIRLGWPVAPLVHAGACVAAQGTYLEVGLLGRMPVRALMQASFLPCSGTGSRLPNPPAAAWQSARASGRVAPTGYHEPCSWSGRKQLCSCLLLMPVAHTLRYCRCSSSGTTTSARHRRQRRPSLRRLAGSCARCSACLMFYAGFFCWAPFTGRAS